ncbi:MAG: hypothetical protein GTO53_03845 [Planctomycetales bacterium]|nr:hypothetical protein [Planctomycetales bacterium]NIM08294.1 hypothetical protein [Planctomycetales bacterium]NIN07785.1 hypothetical protein [Planctomycetales bacterium]NIN76905.1 hypothetical protein [Planctomycetales bacterium]NIO34104.1 hypothetical protein [Planctomycetales bacterium]
MAVEQIVQLAIVVGGLTGLLSLAAWIWILAIAFSESRLHGWLCLLGGPYTLYYALREWTDCKTPLLASLLCGMISLASSTYAVMHAHHSAEVSQLWEQVIKEMGGQTIPPSNEQLLEADKQHMQGRWIVQSGKGGETFHIDGTQCRIRHHKSEDLFDFELVAGEGYRAIDLTSALSDSVTKGIYVLDSGLFKVCLGRTGGERPDTFQSVDGQQQFIVLRRPWN